MKNHTQLLFLGAILLLFSCEDESANYRKETKQPTKTIRIKGSETIRPVMQKVIQLFAEVNPDIDVDYEGGGSNSGLNALKKNKTDIAFFSRPLTSAEKTTFTNQKYNFYNIAFEGLCVVVNRNNPINELNCSQLSDMYSGKIDNWSEVNGEDFSILLLSRDQNSGSYTFFKDKILGNTDYSINDINLMHNEEIVSNVLQNTGAIGYVGQGDLDPNLKVLRIAKSNSSRYVEPNYNSVKSGDYCLARNLSYLISKNSKPHVLQLDSFLRSETVKNIIREAGFFSEEN